MTPPDETTRIGWEPGPVVARFVFAALVLVLIGLSYFPFTWDPPRVVRNDVTRSAAGYLKFGQMNDARTLSMPAWLPGVRTSGRLQVDLSFEPHSAQQQAPIMMLASDFWHSDFAIGQDHADLLVWLRRPGSDANGDPAYTMGGVLAAPGWHSVELMLRGNDVQVSVDGKTRLTDHIRGNSPRTWSPGLIALGDEVHGGGAWQGEIRIARVSTPGQMIDYVHPGALAIPASYLYLPDHIEPFPPQNLEQWWLAGLDLLSFIPVGLLIVWVRRPPVRLGLVTVFAAALALVLAAGKFLFYARHTSLANVLMQVVGAMVGALLARVVSGAFRRGSYVAGDRPISGRKGLLDSTESGGQA